MSNDQRASTGHRRDEDEEDEEEIREIHALTPPPPPPPPANRGRRRDGWETHSRRSSSLSVASTEAASVENFTSMSREFSALVIAGSSINGRNYSTHLNGHENERGNNNNLGRIREEDMTEETNPLAIVPDHNPLRVGGGSASNGEVEVVSVQRVKKEEVEAKISAWQNAKIAKINNRFKREDAVISGWESNQVQEATSWMKKVERKLEEKKARALEKMQNDIAKARRKAEEKRASAEGKRGTKVAKILEVANLMRAVGKFPAKRSFF